MERELAFFTPFLPGTISQRWEVNKTLKNFGSQHSWVPGTLKRVYSRRLNAKTQTPAGINFVQWLQHRLGAWWIGCSIPRRDKRCLLQLSNRPWRPQYRGHSLGTKRPVRETDHYSTSGNNVKNVWSHTSIPSHVFTQWCNYAHVQPYFALIYTDIRIYLISLSCQNYELQSYTKLTDCVMSGRITKIHFKKCEANGLFSRLLCP